MHLLPSCSINRLTHAGSHSHLHLLFFLAHAKLVPELCSFTLRWLCQVSLGRLGIITTSKAHKTTESASSTTHGLRHVSHDALTVPVTSLLLEEPSAVSFWVIVGLRTCEGLNTSFVRCPDPTTIILELLLLLRCRPPMRHLSF